MILYNEVVILFLFYQHFSDFGGETMPGPTFDPASHPAPAPTPSSSAFRPVIPSRQIVERQPRMLDFRVEYRDRNVDVVLEDSCTVGKNYLHKAFISEWFARHTLFFSFELTVNKKGRKHTELDTFSYRLLSSNLNIYCGELKVS